MSRRRFLQAISGFAALCPAIVKADQIVLTLRNSKLGARGQIDFTRAELAGLEQHTITTGNDFIDVVSTFKGPAAFDVIDMIGRAGATTARFTSMNDFFVDIKIAELKRYGSILALERDDVPLPRRGKGPIWLMYPIDLYPELRDTVYNSRLIWQLRSIELF